MAGEIKFIINAYDAAAFWKNKAVRLNRTYPL